MRIPLRYFIWFFVLIFESTVHAEDQVPTDVEALRAAIKDLRQEYETRIEELEKRVAAAEQKAGDASAQADQAAQTAEAAAAAPAPASPGAGSTAFNPAMGVVFQAQAWDYARDPDSYRIPGFPLGGEAGPVPEGLGLGETELVLNANVDDKFTAWLTAPIAVENGNASIDIEEAWIETTALPGGFAARVGRFFSGIGYQNGRHAHAWDFLDQPLPYQAFLGDQYLDDGVQLRWLAPTDLYLEFGGEILRGDRYPAGGADDAGFGTSSLYAKLGGDVGDSNSWLAGLSYLHAGSNDRGSGAEDTRLMFNGETDLAIAQLVWKWSPHGNWQDRNFVVQGEYLWRNENGDYGLPDGSVLPYDNNQDGWYVQAVYQPFPQWRVGARFDTLSSDNPGPAFAGTDLDPAGPDPKRYTVMVDWSNSEFSRLRFQYTRDDAGRKSDDQWGLQYIFSTGAHGAHSF